MSRTLSILASLALLVQQAHAQYTPPDPSGFEGIEVERYYMSDANDAADEDGSSDLTTGEVTYRVFVDLKEGYKLITVGGFVNHNITFNTTTSFFYNDDRGESWGSDLNDIHLEKNTVAIDSWLSAGAASDAHWGIPKYEDTDGSVVGGANNDGGSNSVPGGLLVHEDPMTGIRLDSLDGLLAGTPPGILSVGVAPTIFNEYGGAAYTSDNFAWSSGIGNVEGPTPSNKILIGQFTTDGEFTFCLNLWVRIPDSLVCADVNCHEIMEFYATIVPTDTLGGGYVTENKFTHPTLCFNSAQQQIDCLGVPDGPALPGTPCDDSDPNTANDTWSANCVCEGLVAVPEVNPLAALIQVHPNPAREAVRIEIGALAGQHARYALMDALGQRIVAVDLGVLSGTWKGSVELSGMSSGIYFLEFVVGGDRYTKRISKL
ncbi:MAG: T9SS type A sorting domain-containing protein [Flavobacteriales bacterium]|nr:T9SS type A sorting domain-containing protein [Flavobacteriales bacterium]MBP6697497.1 T9SS type A sorting domain-containing protein [Flavobacteriales bacterium]